MVIVQQMSPHIRLLQIESESFALRTGVAVHHCSGSGPSKVGMKLNEVQGELMRTRTDRLQHLTNYTSLPACGYKIY